MFFGLCGEDKDVTEFLNAAPLKATLSQFVSRWLTSASRIAEIELVCTGHSTTVGEPLHRRRLTAGLSVELILEEADLTSVQTFKRFYHRQQSNVAFAMAVLNNSIYF